MNTWIKWLPVFLLTIGLATGQAAMAATAWVSVPSTPDISGKVTITGGNLATGSQVTVQIVDPNGTATRQVETADNSGAIRVEFLPGMPGGYLVTVIDQGGNEIGKGSFGYSK
ncbi:hypothetical protein KI811_01880 [Geobacter hydrogenophilus]|uniref:DUF3244 domain-containing protein n=1 Tax=Geobacter hydrogenophilus TaxID=40983 RepID=A0A9W6G457_9BACT|nr:hypothetical protein [Geobacter hydrogenophilus]MBT0892571.1 hypothetical protein [Geobacter hydrogenophilus]GLI39968.1 hypothetical protein GHYDROH2_34690 [Geobacter hydrogenophilus]